MWSMIWEVAGTIATLVLTYLFGLLIKKIKNEQLQKEVYEAFEVGVSKVQEDFVTWAKRAAKDGKLTKEERQEAMNMAKKVAIDTASNDKVRSTIMSLASDHVNNIIKNIVATRKA